MLNNRTLSDQFLVLKLMKILIFLSVVCRSYFVQISIATLNILGADNYTQWRFPRLISIPIVRMT